ncbi:hypothetical protein KDW_60480 [Dictyobacter vulcani]|uniref:Glycosyltransferase RgtA/B/C/D-like domain-containing protein n=1 Tax=Dictyobacter vulcani TaxID=2607529 RepID=A0A5J4L346_9CHLR|nr:hypothetical protein [Dictyobacter vulcani]GER91886.1 hypothetical protein KDW_60480 [Dictyobacter vulcani]
MIKSADQPLSTQKNLYTKFMTITQKKTPKNYIVWLVIGMVLLATIGRLLLISNNWPVTNSDEATMALMARHIAQQREWPLMFYGQGYMGAIEAYVAAPFFLLTGPSLVGLRIGLLLFYACFVIALFFHTRFLSSQKFAVFSSLLLCLGSKEIIARQLKAIGGYPELPLLAILLCILVVKIVWSDDERSLQQRRFLYALFGLLSGISLWIDF